MPPTKPKPAAPGEIVRAIRYISLTHKIDKERFCRRKILRRITLERVTGFALHRAHMVGFSVSHIATGANAGRGATEDEAVEAARSVASVMGKQGVLDSIKKAEQIIAEHAARAGAGKRGKL